jgi:glyoxylase-like metal-dependent hydrolase (beta-lactamase superfamily II)
VSDIATWELFALCYGHHERRASSNFLGGDPHDGPMPIDYFLWLARSPSRAVVIDVGFTETVAARRGRRLTLAPEAALQRMGVAAETVEDVVVTHLHYDHVGGFERFPRARFHLQDREMAFATGRYMAHAAFAHAFEVEDVVGMVRAAYGGRVCFHDGDAALFPGLSLHRIGGHTAGLQVVRVMTRRGWVVIASDASHLYANMEEGRPFPIIHDLGAVFDGYRRLTELAASRDHIIPGHDPLVMRRYPAPTPALAGIAVRLDVAPMDVAPIDAAPIAAT